MSDTQITPPAITSLQKILRAVGVSVAVGILLSIIGPFGTYEGMVPLKRFGFWIGAVLLGTFIHIPLFYGASLLGRFHKVPIWIWVSGSAVVAAMPMTFVINGISATLFGDVPLDNLFELYPLVLVISLPMQWLQYFTEDFILPSPSMRGQVDPLGDTKTVRQPISLAQVQSDDTTTKPEPPKAPALFARLPGRLGKALICLQMEDHYVRIYTPLGDTMIHLRMADAVCELDGLEGMLVHRSWWVAREAITGWTRDGKTLLLHLSNGKSAPVARDRQPLVKAAGWLE
jgi:hypothetical protein